jgi:hypothetical protein
MRAIARTRVVSHTADSDDHENESDDDDDDDDDVDSKNKTNMMTLLVLYIMLLIMVLVPERGNGRDARGHTCCAHHTDVPELMTMQPAVEATRSPTLWGVSPVESETQCIERQHLKHPTKTGSLQDFRSDYQPMHNRDDSESNNGDQKSDPHKVQFLRLTAPHIH